jgi:Starch-binding associating with outer membrane
LVDTYGDVPYSEAGKAFLDKTYLPKYDDQKQIYDDLLKEVSEATNALDASKRTEAGDFFYAGNIAKWKRLGNSILLRIAMRFSKADGNKAKQYVLQAIDPARGGVMQSNTDNAFISFSSTFNHPNGNTFQGTERANFYLAKPFVDSLKNNNDPRLAFIAVKYATPANPLATAGPADTNPTNQEGMPLGYNENTIVSAPGYPGKIGAAYKYSQLNRTTVAKIESPEFYITHAQTQLLLAEAAQRTWISGSPAAFYEAGVRAHMEQLKQFDASANILVAAQDAYLLAHPYNPLLALNQINTQYWIASFLNGIEGWANFRRSGFPALAVNTYPQADPSVAGIFIRRLQYPVREKSVNTGNYSAAVARQGADNMATRLFWDK